MTTRWARRSAASSASARRAPIASTRRDRPTTPRSNAWSGETGGPLNVAVGLGGTATLERMARLGVRRISTGGSLFRATYAPLLAWGREMAGEGDLLLPRRHAGHERHGRRHGAVGVRRHVGERSSATSPGPCTNGDPIGTKAFPFFGPRCDYTDDSVCTAAVAEILLDGSPSRRRPATVVPAPSGPRLRRHVRGLDRERGPGALRELRQRRGHAGLSGRLPQPAPARSGRRSPPPTGRPPSPTTIPRG